MGTLYLVRHGQASFGTDDYDRLSPLGTQQCRALGEWMARRGLGFDAVIRGSLRRHVQSLDAIASHLPGLPAAVEWPGLNEYDSEALVRSVALEPLPPTGHDPAAARQHFRLLREGLKRWMAGETEPAGMPSWQAFSEGVAGALKLASEREEGHVLLVSSGGPICTAIGQVLGLPSSGVIELNLRLRNSALSEMVISRGRLALLSFNTLPHLDVADRHGWVTYA
jgi:broad specificity phosphatase PhoE